jgi:hypothetical protein
VATILLDISATFRSAWEREALLSIDTTGIAKESDARVTELRITIDDWSAVDGYLEAASSNLGFQNVRIEESCRRPRAPSPFAVYSSQE